MARPEGGYVNQKGLRILSNTEALSMTRIRRWQGNPADWQRRARIGTAVHTVTAILDCNKTTWEKAPYEWLEEWDAVDPEVKPRCLAWERFKKERRFIARLVEHTIITKTGITDFATTLDREGLLDARTPAIVELKTPKVVEPYWGPQTAGQELAVMCSQGPPKERPFRYLRIVIQLFADANYKITKYESQTDRDVFLWSLGLATWTIREYGFPKD